ncbi:hypothetical protein [Nonomuraea lactucae]|uniref:hypothetical protein n=1 Tax=Nonomuraea lactucae TaxID=2249762 RepID=UPI001F06A7EA|nr:hypothetical protein [Nonomuraea lactucae]
MPVALLAILLPLLHGTVAAGVAPAARDKDAAGQGAIGIRLAEIPASRVDDPRAHRFIVDHVNPGTTITRRFEVVSSSKRPVRAELYPGAASIGKGSFTFAPAGVSNELSSWITLDRAELDLEPHGQATVKATIAVPESASRGERYAVIWAQVSSPGPGPEGNVALVNRVGIRTYLDVGPGGEPPSDFRIGEIVPQRTADGQPKIVAAITNTGRRALDLDGQVSLSEGPSSLSAGPFRIDSGTTLAPGDQGQVVAVLGQDLPGGPWKFRLTLHSGQVERSATGTLTFPARPGVLGVPASLDSPLGLGLAFAALIAVAAVVILLLVRRVRARRRRSGDREALVSGE